jgi:hypothetical protein
MPLDYLRFMNQNRAKGPRRIVSSHRGDSWTPFTRSLASARLALITSAAVRHVNQPVFEPPGDTSYRQVASDTPASDLRIDHRSPVGTDARVDLEIVLPRAALEELARSGVVGRGAVVSIVRRRDRASSAAGRGAGARPSQRTSNARR